ncbi:MAG: zf-HC2 domain-containing protein [Acidimicrobiales bacterium]
MNPLGMASSRVRCLQTMRVLQTYLDGALDDIAAHRVAEHLEDCRRCGLEAEVYRAIKASLSERDHPLDRGAVERLRRFGERLAAEGEDASGGKGL